MSSDAAYDIVENPTEEQIGVIRRGLRSFNRQNWGGIEFKSYLITTKDERGEVFGGAYYSFFGNWLEIEYLWLAEEHRRKGVGSRLVARIEALAREAGCRMSSLNTFDFQAKPFYEKLGYTVVYTQRDIPIKNARYFMEKDLLQSE